MLKTLKKCPVCKHETTHTGTDCPHCNSEYALVTGFASEAAYRAWLKIIVSACKEKNDSMIKNFSENHITVENGVVCIRDNTRNSVTLCNGKGDVQRIDKVKQYSASVRHQVLLLEDGTLEAYGECDSDLSDLKGIKQVYAATGATYAIDNAGNLIVRGVSPIQERVSQWKNVKKIIGNRGRLVALTENGNVLVADDTFVAANPIESELRNLTVAVDAVDVATTYNCTIWLNADGTVGFNGRTSDPRSAVKSWKNIKAIAIENYYAIGLTTEGKVLLAGESIPGIDLGRSEAANWENVIYITCSNSAIMGIFLDGSVKIVGSMERKDAITHETQQEISKFFN